MKVSWPGNRPPLRSKMSMRENLRYERGKDLNRSKIRENVLRKTFMLEFLSLPLSVSFPVGKGLLIIVSVTFERVLNCYSVLNLWFLP